MTSTNTPQKTPPTSGMLRLAFSTAADRAPINDALRQELRDTVDPERHVADRLPSSFNRAVDRGHAAMLVDDQGAVQVLTIAYHCHADVHAHPDSPYEHTNLGTSISYVPGYNISSVVISALSLREWLISPPLQTISAGIAHDNTASSRIYHGHLKWDHVTDDAAIKPVMDASWHSLPDPSDPTGQTPRHDAPAALAGIGWYFCNDNAVKAQAQYLLDLSANNGVIAGKNGKPDMQVDLSCLDAAGLTTSRLTAMAKGGAKRDAVLKL